MILIVYNRVLRDMDISEQRFGLIDAVTSSEQMPVNVVSPSLRFSSLSSLWFVFFPAFFIFALFLLCFPSGLPAATGNFSWDGEVVKYTPLVIYISAYPHRLRVS